MSTDQPHDANLEELIVKKYEEALDLGYEEELIFPDEPTVEHYLFVVKARFTEAKRNDISNLDPYWNKWSLALNKVWIDHCKKNPDSLEVKAALVYWWNRNEFLRLWSGHKFSTKGRQKKLNKDATRLRNTALGKARHNNKKEREQSLFNILKSYATLYESLSSFYNPSKQNAQQPK